LYCTYMFSLETVITCVHCFLFICSSSSRGQASGRRVKWSINIMKLILLLILICCAVAKTHDKLLGLAKGWNTRLRFRMFLFASSLVLVLEIFSGWTVGPLLMPTHYADFKSSSTHRRPERLNCVGIVAGRTTLIDFSRGIRRTVSHLTFTISCMFYLMPFLVLFTIFVSCFSSFGLLSILFSPFHFIAGDPCGRPV
jgi:hypothetical protein